MAVITRIRRIANPRRARFTRNRKGRFVKRTTARRSNVRRAKVKRHATRRRSNPVLLELGAINPRKRSTTGVRKRKYRRNPHRRATSHRRRAVHHRRSHRRRSNPVVHRRRHYARRRRVNHYRRRNPMGYSGKNLLETGGGILLGVAAAKYIPTLLPASMTSMLPVTSFTGPLVTGASAFIAGWAASKFLPPSVSYGVIAGGVALTLSQLLNVIAPPSISGPLALSGVGDITNGNFVVPQNPLKQVIMLPPPSGVSGLKGFRGAFGARR